MNNRDHFESIDLKNKQKLECSQPPTSGQELLVHLQSLLRES